jgi:hypothetical protein
MAGRPLRRARQNMGSRDVDSSSGWEVAYTHPTVLGCLLLVRVGPSRPERPARWIATWVDGKSAVAQAEFRGDIEDVKVRAVRWANTEWPGALLN